MASRRWRFIVVAGLLAFGVSMVQAADITVPNYSFEDQTGSDGTVAYTVDDWDCTGYSNLWVRNPVDGEFTGSTSPNTLVAAGGDGYNSLHLTTNAGNTSTATTADPVATAEEGTEYTLTVSVGNTGYMSANPDYTIHILIDGVSVASETLDGDTITNTEFEDITVSYTADADDDGEDIDIRLSAEAPSGSSAWACWDNVRLEEDSSVIPGDADLDGDVDVDDLQTLATNFGTGDEWSEGDFNDDGDVDVDDLIILRNNFGTGL